MPTSAAGGASQRWAPWLAGVMVAFAIACAGAAYLHGWHIEAAVLRRGYVPWPGGGDGDVSLFWRHAPAAAPGVAEELVGIDTPGLDFRFVLAVALAVHLGLMAWFLRGTVAPFGLAPLSLGLSVLLTGAFLVPAGVDAPFLTVQQDGRFTSVFGGGKAATLCALATIRLDHRVGSRSDSYWVIGEAGSGAALDLAVFSRRRPAEFLVGQLGAIRASACPPP